MQLDDYIMLKDHKEANVAAITRPPCASVCKIAYR